MKNFTTTLAWMSILTFAAFTFSACDDTPDTSNEILVPKGATEADDAQLAFIEAEEGNIIVFEAGVYSFTNTLSMDGKEQVIVRGAGRDQTILDFSGQAAGGEGVLVTNSNQIRFENLTIRDAVGDALKSRDCNKISFVNIATVWTGEPDGDNGAYGLYPVLCTEVYIDGCYAYGASDAGIYVGQSDMVIVKNSVAEGNVAGIEIENTTNADVFNNEAFDNTGGILVFDLPGLTKYGSNTRVYDNNIHDNSRENFAPAGNIVGEVPHGTGFMILSTKNVEIFNNTIKDNNFAGIVIANYLLVNDMPNDPNFDPYPSGISIHDNTYSMSDDISSANQSMLGSAIMDLVSTYGYDQPNIAMDGLLNSDQDVCIQESNATFINLNVADPQFSGVALSTNVSPHNCSQTPLAAVAFEPF